MRDDAGRDVRPAPRVAARVKWGARLGAVLVRLFGYTWRIREHNPGPWRALGARESPYIFAMWHHDLLPMVWSHRSEDVAVIVSDHGDGEIIARIIEGLGNHTVRGSTTRGGTRALIGMIRALERGGCAAITPDGPRGPRHVWQSGVFTAARRANAAIVCVGVKASRAWVFNSWDKFVLPKPFARIDIAYADPEMVQTTSDDFTPETEKFVAIMARMAERAEAGSSRG